jgi:hypothetical protein
MGERSISDSLKTFIDRDVEFVHKSITAPESDATAFYKGYFADWSPIIDNLDVKRSLNDIILSEVFLTSEDERSETVEFYLIKGHAGSGKTVLSKRLSYEAAIEFNKVCFKINQTGFPSYEPLVELYSICKERIFLFIDPVSNFIELIKNIIKTARKDRIPVTIIGCERNSTWNAECEDLYGLVTDSYQVRYLNEKRDRFPNRPAQQTQFFRPYGWVRKRNSETIIIKKSGKTDFSSSP